MVGDERPDERPDDAGQEAGGAEHRLRLVVRLITIGVILLLLVFRVAILPLVGLVSGSTIDDDGITIGTLIGAALLLAGIEVPSLLHYLGGGKK